MLTEHPRPDGSRIVCALNTRPEPVRVSVAVDGTVETVWNGRYVDGKLGCCLSEDMGKTWTKISPDEQQFFAGVVDVVGDRRLFGRVFMATGGNGALYAQRKS